MAAVDAEFVADSPEEFSQQVAAAIAKHDPAAVFGLSSGGLDSTLAPLVADAAGVDFDALVHCNTGIGIDASRHYVATLAAHIGTAYIEGLPPWDDRIASIIMGKEGDPDDRGNGWIGANPQSHGPTRERLKGRVKDALEKAFDGTVVFVTGVRRAESRQRWASLSPVGIDVSSRSGRDYVWANPITNYTQQDVREGIEASGVDPNQVRVELGHSGECLCSAFGALLLELNVIAKFDINLAHAIWWLMVHVNAWWESFPADDKPWPRQYLVPGHGNMKDRELRFLLDGPLQDPAEFRDHDATETDEEQMTFPECAGCGGADPDAREPVVPDGGFSDTEEVRDA